MKRKVERPVCPYCNKPSHLLRNSAILYHGIDYGPVWICEPCKAWVGCHKNNKRYKPLGRLANADLRAAKIRAHAMFDPIWQELVEVHSFSKSYARHKAYEWLAGKMGMTVDTAHIGMFDIEECNRVVELCAEYRAEERAVRIKTVYVASSWRNKYQPDVIRRLRQSGFDVYDFRNPRPGDNGFHWSEIDGDWELWNQESYIKALKHPIAEAGFKCDFSAMNWADACVLVLPCGRSAHIEAGYFVGANKPLFIYVPEKCEPELMYKMATGVDHSFWNMIHKMDFFRS